MMTTSTPLKHAWKECITQGTASEILRADVQEHLRFLQKTIGYKHIRFHASFHDDLGVVERGADGQLIFNWALLDRVYDFLVEIGFDPIVELNPMPRALASGDKTMFFYEMNVTPPAKYEEWEQLVEAYVRHCIERYGMRRIKGWLFEVWNEPNLGGFWSGTQEEYYELYAASARAIKRVDPALRVGGPATAKGGWIVPFATWCRDNNVALDFLSYHNYPMDEYVHWVHREGSPHDDGMAFSDLFRGLHEKLHEAGFGDIPRIITEWNSQHCDENGKAKWVGATDCQRLFSAAAALHTVHHTEPYVDALGWWTASDIMHEAAVTSTRYGDRNQYYGIIDMAGLPKPGYHAFYFLSRLNGPLYEIDLGQRPKLAHGYITDESVTTRALLWNFHMPEFATERWQGTLRLPVPQALSDRKSLKMVTAVLREGQGSSYELWLAMGRPNSLTRIEEEALRAATHPRYRVEVLPVTDGAVDLAVDLGRDEVFFAELVDPTSSGGPRASADLNALNQALDYPEDD